MNFNSLMTPDLPDTLLALSDGLIGGVAGRNIIIIEFRLLTEDAATLKPGINLLFQVNS